MRKLKVALREFLIICLYNRFLNFIPKIMTRYLLKSINKNDTWNKIRDFHAEEKPCPYYCSIRLADLTYFICFSVIVGLGEKESLLRFLEEDSLDDSLEEV